MPEPKGDDVAEQPRKTETQDSAAAPSERADPAGTVQNSTGNEDDDDETCGFCIFMKGGGCKESFTKWSKCVDDERKRGGDFASDCREATFALRECMLKHRDYYAPVLEEEADFVADKEEAAQQ